MNTLSLHDLNFETIQGTEDNNSVYALQNIPPISPYSGFYLTLTAKKIIVFNLIEIDINVLSTDKNINYNINVVSYPNTSASSDPIIKMCRSNQITSVSIPIKGNGYGAIFAYYEEATSNPIVYQNIEKGFYFT